MNYEKQYRAFLQYLQANKLDPYEQLLYHTLLMLNFQYGCPEYFEQTNPSLCALLNISKNTLKKSREGLKEKNLIDFISGNQKGDITKYMIVQLYKGSPHDPENQEIIIKGSPHDPKEEFFKDKGSPHDPKNENLPFLGSSHDPESKCEHVLGSNCGTLNFFADVLEYKKENSDLENIDLKIIESWE